MATQFTAPVCPASLATGPRPTMSKAEREPGGRGGAPLRVVSHRRQRESPWALTKRELSELPQTLVTPWRVEGVYVRIRLAGGRGVATEAGDDDTKFEGGGL